MCSCNNHTSEFKQKFNILKTRNIKDVTLLVMFIFFAQKLEHLLQEFRSLQDTLAEVCENEMPSL